MSECNHNCSSCGVQGCSSRIEKLKNEFMNNRKDQELNNLIKANEEIMNKLQKIKEENKAKTKELIILKKNYERVNTQLMESQRSNSQYNTITDREKTKNINDNPPQKNKNFVGEINDLEYSKNKGENGRRKKEKSKN